ncbi:VanZ family protein [Methylolobus aquaticus]
MDDASPRSPLTAGRRPRTRLRFPRLWQGVGWVMVVVVMWLSLTPHPPQPPSLLAWDKAQHLTAYAGLMFWFRQAFAPHWRWPAFLLGLGITIELLQGFTGARVADLFDIVANGLGVAIGLILAQSPLGRMLAAVDSWLALGPA